MNSDGNLLVLTYHAIDWRPSVISVSPELFRWQMESLAARGVAGISLAQALDHHESTGRYPSNAVVLTFDDGYLSVLEHALPVMTALGFRATAFLVTSLMGMDASQARIAHPGFDRDLFSWQQAEAWVRSGFEVGSHTSSHPDLRRLSAVALEQELARAREILEQRLQPRVDALAYPYGYFNVAVRAAAGRHHRRACTTRLGRCPPQPDLLQLQRVDAYYVRHRRRFLELLDGGGSGWLQLRQFLRDLKEVAVKPYHPSGENKHP